MTDDEREDLMLFGPLFFAQSERFRKHFGKRPAIETNIEARVVLLILRDAQEWEKVRIESFMRARYGGNTTLDKLMANKLGAAVNAPAVMLFNNLKANPERMAAARAYIGL